MIDFDSPDQSAHDVAAAIPVQLANSGPHSRCELLEVPNDQNEISLEVERLDERDPFTFQSAETLLQAADARLELGAVDDPFRVSINQSVDTATEPRDLSIHAVDILSGSVASLGISNSTLVLLCDPRWVLQHSLDLRPNRLLELVAPDRTIVAGGLPAEAMSIGARAAVVAVVGGLSAANEPARHLPVERVTTAAADDQTLQQPPRSTPTFSLALAIFIELQLRRLELRLVDQRGDRDRDPLLPRRRASRAGCPLWRLRTPSDWTQTRLRWHRSSAAEHGHPAIHRIAQHPANGSGIPASAAGLCGTPHLLQATADLAQTDPIDADPGEDRADDAGFVLTPLKTRDPAAGMSSDVAIPKGRTA